MKKILILMLILFAVSVCFAGKRIDADYIKADTAILPDITGQSIEIELPTETLTYSGTTVEMVNGNTSAVAFGDVCYFAADGDLEFADADTVSTMPGLFMAVEAIGAGSSGKWVQFGYIRNNLWTLTQGGYVYISITGTTGNTWTQTRPTTSGNNIQIIGIAKSSNTICFKPDFTVIELK